MGDGMDFFDCDFDITDIVLSCKVLAGCGDKVHKDRTSHGLALNLDGEKRYCFDSGRVITVKKNDIIFLPEGSSYVVQDLAAGDCYAVNFKLREKTVIEPFVFHTSNFPLFSECFQKTEKAFAAMKKGYMAECKARLYLIIATMISEHELKYTPAEKKKSLLPAVEYIHNNYSDKEILVEHLAAMCNMRPSYFRQLFSQCYGTAPIKYINALKLERAKMLLANTDYPVDDISVMAGFNNACYFHRYFKKQLGETPLEYRMGI